MFAACYALCTALALAAPADAGRNLYVDPARGNDRASGLAEKPTGNDGPLKTLHPAIRRARPGDTIHLVPGSASIHDIAVFHDVHGEPGRPITLDGHGATLTGCEPLDPDQWNEAAPGVYRCDHLIGEKLLTQDEAVVERWFMLFDGRINHMGRCRKGKMAPLVKVADLQPGQWTYEAEGHAFYVKIDPDQSLADARIEAPLRSDGVQISGDCSHLVIRNLIATHVYNDGYGLHGKMRAVKFENIQAIECGDDGMSAHDDCQLEVDGFISLRNATGLANTGASRSTNRRLFLDGNLGTDLLIFGSGEHTITDSVIRCTGAYSLRLWSDTFDNPGLLELDNVLIERGGETSPLKIWHNGVLKARNITIVGLGIQADGRSVSLEHCLLAGGGQAEVVLSPPTVWMADHNFYDVARFRVGEQSYGPAEFAAFRRATSGDADSRWESLGQRTSVPGFGADPARLPAATK